MRSRHLPCEGPEIAQPWKFHSLTVVVSRRIQGLAGVGGSCLAAAVSALASEDTTAFASTGGADFFAGDGSGLVSYLLSASVSPLRKNSASFPSMRLTKTRKLLPSGP